MTPKSGKLVPLLLDTMDLGQTLDALDTRAEAYERTAEYLDGADAGGLGFVIEEVNDAAEARSIAEHFRHVQTVLQAQWNEWCEQQSE